MNSSVDPLGAMDLVDPTGRTWTFVRKLDPGVWLIERDEDPMEDRYYVITAAGLNGWSLNGPLPDED